jgi:hypothetical protein
MRMSVLAGSVPDETLSALWATDENAETDEGGNRDCESAQEEWHGYRILKGNQLERSDNEHHHVSEHVEQERNADGKLITCPSQKVHETDIGQGAPKMHTRCPRATTDACAFGDGVSPEVARRESHTRTRFQVAL